MSLYLISAIKNSLSSYSTESKDYASHLNYLQPTESIMSPDSDEFGFYEQILNSLAIESVLSTDATQKATEEAKKVTTSTAKTASTATEKTATPTAKTASTASTAKKSEDSSWTYSVKSGDCVSVALAKNKDLYSKYLDEAGGNSSKALTLAVQKMKINGKNVTDQNGDGKITWADANLIHVGDKLEFSTSI